MLKFIFKKTLKLITLLVGVSVAAYLLVSYSPIDPVQTYIGESGHISPEQREQIEAYWGLHESKTMRFFKWGKAILKGDFGTSLIYRTPVAEVISIRFKASLALMGMAWLFSGIIGFALGIIAGMKKGTWIDKLIKGYAFILASTPTFWLGLIILMIFAVQLGWFPIGLAGPIGSLDPEIGFSKRLHHLILPAVTLSIIGIANVALHTREKLIDIFNSEFIRFARAKGKSGFSLLWNHGLRNISLPAISLHFASFGELFGGIILAEQVFSYPGLGNTVVRAGLGGDIPLLLGITLWSVIFIFTGNLIADLLYWVIDPRMKNEWKNG